ncbi:MAG: hypothetical protein ABIR58_06425, partial [Gemmatimonadaceae bacterium]
SADTVTRVQMQNVDFYIDPRIPLRIRHLRGTMRSKSGGPIMLDDKKSFIMRLDDAEVGLTGPELSLLLNNYVFNFPGSPLRRLAVTTSGTQIVQKGILHKVTNLPFEITANISVTPDGRIRIHPTRTVILGIHVDQLMNGLGLTLDKIIDLRKSKGASVSGNDIFLDPNKILPPPTMEGTVTRAWVEGSQVVQRFGEPIAAMPIPDSAARNYMFFKGGSIRFGKLLMSDAELEIVDLDPADPLRFDLDRYLPQLVAGYSRTFPNGGLEAFMRDVDKLGAAKIESSPAVPRR